MSRKLCLTPRGKRVEVRGDIIEPTSNRCLRFEDSFLSFLAIFFVISFLFFFNRADAGRIPTELIQRRECIQNVDMVVFAEPLITRIKNGEKMLFIDIRSAADFEVLHIPGSMNIPMHFIKTKPQLKSIPMVLVDQGLSSQRLLPACRQLKKIGFDALILDGGMHAWGSHGGPMVGEPVRQMDYDRISPADFFLEKDDAKHIVCDVSATRSPTSLQLMPYAVHLPLSDRPGSSVDPLETFKAVHVRNEEITVLVVNQSGEGYPSIRTLFDCIGIKNVFYLEGGIHGYREYLEGVGRSWGPRRDRLVTHHPCGECGTKE